MIHLLVMMLLSAQAATETRPYNVGASSTAEGARRAVSRLLAATDARDDNAFDKVARGMAIMLTPDFGAPVTRAAFAEFLKGCTGRHIESVAAFPKMPQVQVVRIAMQCLNRDHPEPAAVVADIIADDEHAFAVFPGGVAEVWPSVKP